MHFFLHYFFTTDNQQLKKSNKVYFLSFLISYQINHSILNPLKIFNNESLRGPNIGIRIPLKKLTEDKVSY